jgi:hypothetical protein
MLPDSEAHPTVYTAGRSVRQIIAETKARVGLPGMYRVLIKPSIVHQYRAADNLEAFLSPTRPQWLRP